MIILPAPQPVFAMLFAYQWERSKRHYTIEIRVLSAVMATALAGIPLGALLAERHYQQPIPVAGRFLVVLVVTIAGWLCVYRLAGMAVSKSRQLVAVSAMMLASMLLLFYQADTLMIRSNSSIRPMAEAILREQASKGGSDVFVSSGRHYSLEVHSFSGF